MASVKESLHSEEILGEDCPTLSSPPFNTSRSKPPDAAKLPSLLEQPRRCRRQLQQRRSYGDVGLRKSTLESCLLCSFPPILSFVGTYVFSRSNSSRLGFLFLNVFFFLHFFIGSPEAQLQRGIRRHLLATPQRNQQLDRAIPHHVNVVVAYETRGLSPPYHIFLQ